MLAIQKYFVDGGTPEALEASHGIKSRAHKDYPELLLFKYGIGSDFSQEICQEARGIILDSSAGWRPVCFGYRKFHNYGEALAAPIEWSSARVYEKLDGSLVQLYRYAGKWNVATSGTPDGSGEISGRTFEDLFWSTFRASGYDLGRFDPGRCYLFELCAPENRVVVRYLNAALFLHGVRNMTTLREENPEAHGRRAGVPTPLWHPLASVEECQAAAASLDPLEAEGYVVVDRWFQRVKIKSPAYVALHHAKDGLLNRRHLANLIRAGEAEEFTTALAAFPEHAQEFEALRAKHEGIVEAAQRIFPPLRTAEDQKAYAAEVKKHGALSGLLFSLRKKVPANDGIEAATREYLAALSDPAYLRLVGEE